MGLMVNCETAEKGVEMVGVGVSKIKAQTVKMETVTLIGKGG
jgi:hypothetical protein